ncbi:MAG: phage portal protein [Parvibaculaceae bacterium]
MLKRLFTALSKKSQPVTGWEALVDYGRETAAGILVSPDMALRCTAVYAGVRVRCETLGSLPLHLYERLPDGGKKRADAHPLYRLLHDRPNPWTSSAELVMQLEKDGITHGAGYALANRSGDKIVELIRLQPGSVAKEIDEATLEPRYRVTVKGNLQRVYAWQDILEVPGLDGLSAVKQANEAIGLCIAMERHAARLFGQGGRPSGVLKVKQALSQAAYDRLKASWDNAHAGVNSGKTAILESEADFSPLTFNSVDLQFQELRAFQVVEIARALAVPPNLLFDFSRATWSNSEQMAQSYVTFCILPRMRVWCGAISRLMSAEEQKKYFPEFMIDELVKADIAARFEAYSKAIASRVLNPNEVRSKENLPPYEGGDEFVNPNISPGAEPEPAARPKPRLAA